MLQWLNSNTLLTHAGKSLLRSIDCVDPANISLTRDHVKQDAWAFLDAQYQIWYDNIAINYAIDESLPFNAQSELDEMWEAFREAC